MCRIITQAQPVYFATTATCQNGALSLYCTQMSHNALLYAHIACWTVTAWNPLYVVLWRHWENTSATHRTLRGTPNTPGLIGFEFLCASVFNTQYFAHSYITVLTLRSTVKSDEHNISWHTDLNRRQYCSWNVTSALACEGCQENSIPERASFSEQTNLYHHIQYES